MTEQEIKDAARKFLKSWTTGDIKQASSFFAEDAEWITPQVTVKGIAEIEKFLKWSLEMIKDYKITETGIGMVVQGDTIIVEHDLSGTSNGKKWVTPAICIDEFKNGKVVKSRSYFDALSQAQQVAKGIFAKWIVNTVVNTTKKGL